MAISRFTEPIESNIIPIPFEALAKAGIAKQTRFDTAETTTNRFVDSLFQLPHARKDEPEFRERIGGLEGQIGELVEGVPDKSSFEFRRGLNDIIRQQARDPFFRESASNLQTENQLLGVINDQGATEEIRFRARKQLAGFKGTAETGLLDPFVTPKPIDFGAGLLKRGLGFQKQGLIKGLLERDEAGDIKPTQKTTSEIGVFADEVAFTFGLDYRLDASGNENFNLKEIPFAVKNDSTVWPGIIRQAEFLTDTLREEDPDLVDKMAEEIYAQEAENVVRRVSGLVKTEKEKTQTNLTNDDANTSDDGIDPIETKGNAIQLLGRPGSIKASLEFRATKANEATEAREKIEELRVPVDSRVAKHYIAQANKAELDASQEDDRITTIKGGFLDGGIGNFSSYGYDKDKQFTLIDAFTKKDAPGIDKRTGTISRKTKNDIPLDLKHHLILDLPLL